MPTTFSVIIPARFASSRLPGKVLLELAGKPLLWHVYRRALESGAQRVIIATDDARVEAAARIFEARVEMTAASHASGTDRIAEVVSRLGLADDEIVVNLQGDEPLMPAAVIRQVAERLAMDPGAAIATVCERITEARDLFDPAVVKVVMDAGGRALYFSRAPIPWDRDGFSGGDANVWPTAQPYYRHVGLYAYRVGFLKMFSVLPACELERTECLEQLRALDHGARILVDEAIAPSGFGIDTMADLERVRGLLAPAP